MHHYLIATKPTTDPTSSHKLTTHWISNISMIDQTQDTLWLTKNMLFLSIF